ncbi:MAG: hypothetical protein IMF18_04930 [Proteobacteria bacterium]|nr:hypothetical protein [Pseudomonadota bacterium]
MKTNTATAPRWKLLTATFLLASVLVGCCAEHEGSNGGERPYPKDKIDFILRQMEFGNIAFNTPRSINIQDTAIIQLLLNVEIPFGLLKQQLEWAGSREGAKIKISDRMEARLKAPNFLITPISPEIQAISRKETTEWKWEIKPKSTGRHYVHLTLSALLNVEGESTPRAIRTFDRRIEIDITWGQLATGFLNNNWQWLWAALIVPLAGWIWKKKYGGRKKGTSDSYRDRDGHR